MKRNRLAVVALVAALLISATGAVSSNILISSKISSRLQKEFTNGSEISSSIPLIDLPWNLTRDSIKSLTIKVSNYTFKGSDTPVLLEINAGEISKNNPITAKTIGITATIPASTILKNAQFDNAQIVGETLQVTVGAGGGGIASLVPRYSKNKIYFQLKSVSIFGNEIPASSLPSDFQRQIRSKSTRNFEVPEDLEVESLRISAKGLAINLVGKNIQLHKLNSSR